MLLNPIIIICILMFSLGTALMNGNGVKEKIGIFLIGCPSIYLVFWWFRFIAEGH